MAQSHMSGLDEGFVNEFWADPLHGSEAKGEANPWMMMMMINQSNQNHQLATPLYTQASTSNGLNTHMVYHGNNSPSPQPAAGTSRAPKLPITGSKKLGTAGDPVEKKRLNDKAYRERVKEGRKEMERKLEELAEENKNLKRKNECLKKEKDLAEEKCKRAKDENNQLESEVCRLRHQSDDLRVCVEAFTQKVFDCENVYNKCKRLEDELAGLTGRVFWEDWMSEKLRLMDRIELLKYQNRSLNVQVEALCKKKRKREDPIIRK